jgi:mannose-1-phosphate guanylyltransferase/phosphomannomutase
MKAVVMAGGFGTRIQPLTNSVPKPMLPVANIPMMEHIINKVIDAGIKDIVILLYFKPEVIKEHFGDGSRLGVNIEYVLPDDDYGTAGAVKKAEPFLNDTFMIVSGDLVTDFDFKKIIDFHEKKQSKLTITLTPVVDPLQFGVVITDEDGKIQKFLEKPSWGEVFSDTINTGIYILDPEILSRIPEGENFDFGKNLFPNLMAEGIPLWGCSVEGYWRDVGNPKSYREAHLDILEGSIKLKYKGEKKEFPRGVAYLEDGAVIDESATIEGSVVIGKNTHIQGNVKLKDVIIGDDCVVAEGSEIKDSIIWDRCSFGLKCDIYNSVICNDNRFGKKVKIKEGAIIAEGCEVDHLVSFEKDVIVWPQKMIEEASVISNNIIWGTKYKASIFESGKVVGRANLELYCEMATKIAESFGSMLPVGSKVYLSRDYHKSSRMIKRAVLVGLISTGVDAIDVRVLPSNVMRHNLAQNNEIAAGIHVRQSIDDITATEILFFNNEGLFIDTNTEKSCERVFFRENFRRVSSEEIGEIVERDAEVYKLNYEKLIHSKINKEAFNKKELKVGIDLLFGSTSNIVPDILNGLDIENVVLNAYSSDKKLSKLPSLLENSQKNISKIVKSLSFDMGFVIFPNGQKLRIADDSGNTYEPYMALLGVLKLIDLASRESVKVFLPVNTPDILDSSLKNVKIERGKFSNFTEHLLKEYYLIANTDGNFAFSDFGLQFDSVFACIKILELLAITGADFSSLTSEISDFYYKEEMVDCPADKKGKMMRKFMEEGKDRETSYIDGIKFWLDNGSSVLMIPSTSGDFVKLYVQASSIDEGERVFAEYADKIKRWRDED